jgi:hypothetical protein
VSPVKYKLVFIYQKTTFFMSSIIVFSGCCGMSVASDAPPVDWCIVFCLRSCHVTLVPRVAGCASGGAVVMALLG